LTPDPLEITLFLKSTLEGALSILQKTLLPLAQVGALDFVFDLVELLRDTAFRMVALVTHVGERVVKELKPIFGRVIICGTCLHRSTRLNSIRFQRSFIVYMVVLEATNEVLTFVGKQLLEQKAVAHDTGALQRRLLHHLALECF
jgi:hypothetical protein